MIWLKIVYHDNEISNWPENPNNISVSISYEAIAPTDDGLKSSRLSPIFPLSPSFCKPCLDNTTIHFFTFVNAYKVLGRLEKSDEESLRNAIFFSIGLSSIILITEDKLLLEVFREIITDNEKAHEEWLIKDSTLVERFHTIIPNDEVANSTFNIPDYSILPLTERAIIDEFGISIRMLLLKMRIHMPGEVNKINLLVVSITKLINELVYLITLDGNPPESISEFRHADLINKNVSDRIRNQNLDRIIQVNSALSYVSTQAFSGAIPILERRSLIRRNSLLGIGSAILALNNVVRIVEECFAKVPIRRIITQIMPVAKPLAGMEQLWNCDPKDWHTGSVSKLAKNLELDIPNWKLPYFSGRLGFRETEYSIAAALQSLTSGASLEWSLMTLTHEMLHGHVREIIDSIFYGEDELNAVEQRKLFYDNFQKVIDKKGEPQNLIESVRTLLLAYCTFSTTHGSITTKPEDSTPNYNVILPTEDDLWNLLERENRNINELFVHILDLHYFYASRTSVYIPLIWCSWVVVPHIVGDLRQYILRSLLTIASKLTGSKYSRFLESVKILKELLLKHKDGKLNSPVILQVITILEDEDKKRKYYFPTFNASLVIVDVVYHIFRSTQIRSALFNDDLLSWEDSADEEDFEKVFKYNLPEGFNDETIKAPLSYLLDRMIKDLNSTELIGDLERETTLQFLALNSNS